mmetsp:Transcript_36844/g.71048  ORF Transcript_36844/g.71048 Transcript_36844/m.71048 type:complete len:163 (+) Transcript_36844:2112-2600(+)
MIHIAFQLYQVVATFTELQLSTITMTYLKANYTASMEKVFSAIVSGVEIYTGSTVIKSTVNIPMEEVANLRTLDPGVVFTKSNGFCSQVYGVPVLQIEDSVDDGDGDEKPSMLTIVVVLVVVGGTSFMVCVPMLIHHLRRKRKGILVCAWNTESFTLVAKSL